MQYGTVTYRPRRLTHHLNFSYVLALNKELLRLMFAKQKLNSSETSCDKINR
jgi:hypothetical protein